MVKVENPLIQVSINHSTSLFGAKLYIISELTKELLSFLISADDFIAIKDLFLSFL